MAVAALWSNTQFAFDKFPHYLRLKYLEGKILKPYIHINFENQFYQVKTIDCPQELIQVLKLRFEVFYKEFSEKKITFPFFHYDVDKHDFLCDHLIVKDKSTGEIVASYRLLSSHLGHKIKHFYSESEFVIDDFLKQEGHKLELGRACVHKHYRSGSVIGLLWKGMCEYARKSETRFMFGCSSVTRKDYENLPSILNYFEKSGAYLDSFQVGVQPECDISQFPEIESLLKAPLKEGSSKRNGLNSIMHMYLLAGAKMGRSFAYDKDMDCVDIFTVMDFKSLPANFERRFSC